MKVSYCCLFDVLIWWVSYECFAMYPIFLAILKFCTDERLFWESEEYFAFQVCQMPLNCWKKIMALIFLTVLAAILLLTVLIYLDWECIWCSIIFQFHQRFLILINILFLGQRWHNILYSAHNLTSSRPEGKKFHKCISCIY